MWAALLFGLAFVAVVWGSLAPGTPSLNVSYGDKVQHFGAYALLAGLAFLTFRRRSWIAAGVLIALGVGVELLQVAQDLGREGSVLDAAANSAGVLLATAAWRGPRRR